MPTRLANFAIAAYQGKIYCIGITPANMWGRGETYSMNEVYDIDTDSWSTKTALPISETKSHQAYVVDEKIFVLADYDLFMYDPIADSWTAKTSIPEKPVASITSFVVDNKLMIVAGFVSENTVSTKTLVYDLHTDSWSERTNLPFTNIYGAVGVTSGIYAPQRVYIFTSDLSNKTTSTLVYDPAKDTWSVSEGMPTMRISCGVAVVDDVLYVVGGFIPGQSLSTNEQYVPLGYQDPLSSGSIFSLTNIVLVAGIVVLIIVVVVVLMFSSTNKEKQ
jgi:N-acetylneuraminic acid mutarotase